MADNLQQVTASLTAQNTGTDWLKGPPKAQISVSGTWVATVFLQRKLKGEASSAAVDVESYTANTEKVIPDGDGAYDYRLFCKTGGFTSGTIVCKLTRG